MSDKNVEVRDVRIQLCDLCLQGKGDECHTPGCALFLHNSPGHPINENFYEIITAGSSSASVDSGVEWKLSYDSDGTVDMDGGGVVLAVDIDREVAETILKAHNAATASLLRENQELREELVGAGFHSFEECPNIPKASAAAHCSRCSPALSGEKNKANDA